MQAIIQLLLLGIQTRQALEICQNCSTLIGSYLEQNSLVLFYSSSQSQV